MAKKTLSEFITVLENHNELVRIKEFASPKLEVAEITDRIVKSGGKALLFENNGTKFPLLINAFGSENRICHALGVNNLEEISNEIDMLFKKVVSSKSGLAEKVKFLPVLNELASWMPKTVKKKGVCQEIIMAKPDINLLPVLTCWPNDGGPFVTLPVVHTVDPNTGIRNVGMYRMQIFSSEMTGMHWHLHKNSARHFNEYKKLGKRMPVSVTLGGDPVYTYVATAPLPDNIDEYIFAGFLRKEKVKMVKCLTNDLEVPGDVDFVIEGYVDPAEDLINEGPFGDHTGFYSLPELYPRFHITCITHRRNAVYPTTIVGIPPQEDAWLGKATERIFLSPIKLAMQPEIVDMNMPVEGVFHNLVILKTKNDYPGQGKKIINGLWGAGQMMFTKVMIAMNDRTDIFDYKNILKLILNDVDFAEDIIFSKGPDDILDHSSEKYAYGGKIAIDATTSDYKKVIPVEINKNEILAQFSEIVEVNSDLCQDEIPMAVISFSKNKVDHHLVIAEKIRSDNFSSGLKCIVFVDAQVDVYELKDLAWLVLNNIDPGRDIRFIENTMIIDGTRKTKEFDNFKRSWPNVIVSDDATIKTVDEKWLRLGLGEFIESPSLKYKKLLWPGGAQAE